MANPYGRLPKADPDELDPAVRHRLDVWFDKAYRDATLKEPQKKEYLQKGIEAVDQAIKIKPDYMEALVYKGLLLRLEANLEKDAKKQAELMKEANALRDRAEELRKKKAAGVGE